MPTSSFLSFDTTVPRDGESFIAKTVWGHFRCDWPQTESNSISGAKAFVVSPLVHLFLIQGKLMCITGAAFLLLCPVLLCRSARRRSSRPTWHEVLEAEGGGRRRGGGRAVKASPSPVKAAVQRALNGPQFAVGSGYNDSTSS